MTSPDRRFIEETFPVKDVSQHAAKEKNIRHGHISTLHIWWARRPLAASRATAYAALIPATQDILEWQKQRGFIVELCRWENSLNLPLLERARRALYAAHAERLSAELGRPVSVADIEAGRVPPPRVLDPFSGGGSYPLEALRLGCEVYANDYNPVAVLILKATLEYPQKYGTQIFMDATGERGWLKNIRANPSNSRASVSDSDQQALFELEPATRPTNPLLEAVKYWGEWVLNEARRELEGFYSTRINTDATDEHGFSPDKNIRANPSNRRAAVSFSIVGDGYAPWPKDFDPERGTVKGAVVTCPCCGQSFQAAIWLIVPPHLPAQLVQRPSCAKRWESLPPHSWREHRERPSTKGVNECTEARPYSFIRSLFVDGSPQ